MPLFYRARQSQLKTKEGKKETVAPHSGESWKNGNFTTVGRSNS